ncbi:hypothetical protein Goarm_004081 [Gossypium armourianum]|uniref:RNase H type-1 domain-containing protein n=1 Tax=Gossypium armourianum TaxID=34283 RepID=A0A7J9K563_9ROSI|nr:hypothetical protein [Gossypium armourianum]
MMISQKICEEIERMVRSFIWGSSSEEKKLALAKRQEASSVIPWKDSWVQLNVDGVVNVESGSAASSEILNDQEGKWILGYKRYLGNYSVLEAKLWRILDGLNALLSRKFDKFLIQTDSIEVVKAPQIFTKTSLNSDLIRRIQQLLLKVGNWLP